MGEDGCWESQLWPRLAFQLHFGSLFESLDGSLEAPGLRLASDWAPWLQIGVLGVTFGPSGLHFGVGLGAPGDPLGVTWCQFGCLGHPKLMLEATRLT